MPAGRHSRSWLHTVRGGWPSSISTSHGARRAPWSEGRSACWARGAVLWVGPRRGPTVLRRSRLVLALLLDHLRDCRSEPVKTAKSTAYRQTDGKFRNERSHVGKVPKNQARPERSDQDEANSNTSSTDQSGREGSIRWKCALEQKVMAFFGSLSSRKVRWGREPTVIGWSRPERSAQDEGQQ